MDIVAYAMSKKYTEESLDGIGALKGAPCTIKSITDNVDGTHTIVFEWTSNSGVKQESRLTVSDGADGAKGADGATGPAGKDGATGPRGPAGDDGEDGVSITNLAVDDDGHLIVMLSNDATVDAGEVVGEAGFSPVITVKANTASTYVLHIKTADAEYDTPNLKGSGGGGGSVDVDTAIDSTSENPVQNKAIAAALDGKVDAVSGKGLSSNDYTDAEKEKLRGIEAGAEKNPDLSHYVTDSDYNPTSKTAVMTQPVGADENGALWTSPGGGGSGGVRPQILVTAPSGSEVSVAKGSVTLTAQEESGTGGFSIWSFELPTLGLWTIQVTDGEWSRSKQVNVTAVQQYSVTFSPFTVYLHVLSPAGSTLTCEGNNTTQTILSTGDDTFEVYTAGTYTVTRDYSGKTDQKQITVTNIMGDQTVQCVLSFRYGYRKTKAEGSPYDRIVYLYDAVGMTPAYMDFTGGTFRYGDWENVFFVKKNRPVMLKSDGTVDYELDHNDQTLKLDGSESDISDTSYDGNAVSEIPLCWFYRYEDDTYEYEIVCEHQYDENYKAYAHTRADGSIADCFYWGMFGGSGNATKLRSIADQAVAQSLTTQQQIAGASANGRNWFIHTWSQRSCIITLLVLMGKSTNTQAIFGNGNCRDTGASGLIATGTLKDKGRFFGYNSSTQQVKVFYIEEFWGNQWKRTAGILNSGGQIYYKITPDGDGYKVENVTGYTNSGITLTGTKGGYISATSCGEYGCIPTTVSGSGSTYECDGGWVNNSQLDYLISGACAANASAIGGAFAFSVSDAPSYAAWLIGCALSYI